MHGVVEEHAEPQPAPDTSGRGCLPRARVRVCEHYRNVCVLTSYVLRGHTPCWQATQAINELVRVVGDPPAARDSKLLLKILSTNSSSEFRTPNGG